MISVLENELISADNCKLLDTHCLDMCTDVPVFSSQIASGIKLNAS